MKSKRFWNLGGGGSSSSGGSGHQQYSTSPPPSSSSSSSSSSPTNQHILTNSQTNGGGGGGGGGGGSHVKEGPVFCVPLNEIFKRYSTVNNIPNVVYHITTNIRQYAMSLEGIFRVPGSNQDIQQLKKLYDAGKISTHEQLYDRCEEMHTQASLLKLFIRELPDPLFTFQLYESFVKSHDNRDKPTRVASLKSLLNQLPLAHYSLLKHLASLLRDISRNSSVNKMTSSNLAIVFGPTVMRPQHENMIKMIEDARHVNGVFLLIIDEFEYLFNGAEFPAFILNYQQQQQQQLQTNLSISPSLINQLQGQSTGGKRNAGQFSSSTFNIISQPSSSISSNPIPIPSSSNNNHHNSRSSVAEDESLSPRLDSVSPSSPITHYDEFFSAMALRSPPPPPPPSPLSPTSLSKAVSQADNQIISSSSSSNNSNNHHHHLHKNSPSSSNLSRFSILLPTSNQSSNNTTTTNNNCNNQNHQHQHHPHHHATSTTTTIHGSQQQQQQHHLNSPTLGQRQRDRDRECSPTLSPLPPTSPRSSMILDYENPELIRVLIHKTCSMLFEKDMTVTDQFEYIPRPDEHHIVLDMVSSYTNLDPTTLGNGTSIPTLAPLLSPRYLRSASLESIVTQSSSSSSSSSSSQSSPNPISLAAAVSVAAAVASNSSSSSSLSSSPSQSRLKHHHHHHNHHHNNLNLPSSPSSSPQIQPQSINNINSNTNNNNNNNNVQNNQNIYGSNNLTNSFLLVSDQNTNGNQQQQQQQIANSNNSPIISEPLIASPKLVRANSAEPGPLETAWAHLIQVRRECGRASDLKSLTANELKDEKSAIKKELREFDIKFKKDHGHLPKKNDKEVMRPLYQRYREVKALLELSHNQHLQQQIQLQQQLQLQQLQQQQLQLQQQQQQLKSVAAATTPITSLTTSPIMFNPNTNNQQQGHHHSSNIPADDVQKQQPTKQQPTAESQQPLLTVSPPLNGNYHRKQPHHDMVNEESVQQQTNKMNNNEESVLERYNRVKMEKRSLQIDLHKYQTDFVKRTGRKVQFVDDRLPVQKEYERYKILKQELSELEKVIQQQQQQQQHQ